MMKTSLLSPDVNQSLSISNDSSANPITKGDSEAYPGIPDYAFIADHQLAEDTDGTDTSATEADEYNTQVSDLRHSDVNLSGPIPPNDLQSNNSAVNDSSTQLPDTESSSRPTSADLGTGLSSVELSRGLTSLEEKTTDDVVHDWRGWPLRRGER